MSQNHVEQRWCHSLVWLFAALLFAGCADNDGPNADPDNNEPTTIIAPALKEEPREMTPSQLRKALGVGDKAIIQKELGRIRTVAIGHTRARNLTPLKGLKLTYLDITALPISDISALDGMPLERLMMDETQVDNLSILKGMPLKYLGLKSTKVADLSVLKGMPLESLYAEETEVADISALEGMPLRELYLINTQVSDISALKGMPLVHLSLIGTKVIDLSVIESLSLKILWLRKTPVEDLSPLSGSALPSLDIQDTPVSDISVAQEMPALVRLNIAGTKITDLTPLKDRNLTRLIFTPENITKGIDVVRAMQSLTQLDTSFEGDSPTAMTPRDFWAKYDAGDFDKKPTKKPKGDD